LHTLRFAESANKSAALYSSPLQQAPLRENQRPGNQAEGKQNQQNHLGDGAALHDEINNLATNKNCQQDRKMHEVLGIPGFDYRPEWPADRSMCTSSGNGKYTFCSESFEAMRLEMAHVPGLLFTSSLQELSGEESACIPAVLDAP
jgi:hypothetical protein